MTEDQANNKRCCGPEGCGVVGNPDYEGGPCSRWCVASLCMGWRWIYAPDEALGIHPEMDLWAADGYRRLWRDAMSRIQAARKP